MLSYGLLDINRTVVHGLAESMNVRGETFGHFQQVRVVAVAQEDEVELPVDRVVLAHRRPVEPVRMTLRHLAHANRGRAMPVER